MTPPSIETRTYVARGIEIHVWRKEIGHRVEAFANGIDLSLKVLALKVLGNEGVRVRVFGIDFEGEVTERRAGNGARAVLLCTDGMDRDIFL